MRFFEIIIILVNLPLVYWLLLPSKHFPKWARFIPLLGAVITIIHLIVEGYRWQMYPLYLLVVVFLILVIARQFRQSEKHHIRNKALSIATGSVVTLLLLSSAALGTLLPVFSLPKPSGPYPVGTVSYHWIDETRDEVYTSAPSDKREIMVQFWYPAAEEVDPEPNYYWQDYAEEMSSALAKDQRLPGFFLSHFNLVKTNAYLEAPLSDQQSTYPIVIYSHGNGCGRSWATFQMEDLASHGYIVIALDRTYNTMATVFPDGRVILPKPPSPMIAWNDVPDSIKLAMKEHRIGFAAKGLSSSSSNYDSVSFRDPALSDAINEITETDISFVINQLEVLNANNSGSIFENSINLHQIGTMGFSDGGGIAESISRRDQRIKALITQDASTPGKTDLQQPVLCVLSEFTKQGINPKMNHIKIYRDQYSGQMIKVDFVLIKGIFHNNFTDGPLYSPLKAATDAGPMDPVYAHHIINTFTVTFFDRHLKGNKNISISALSKKFIEVYYDSVFSE